MSYVRHMMWFGPYRLLRLMGITPIGNVLNVMSKHGWVPEHMKVLELFGGTGKVHLRHYVDRAESITAWEIDQQSAAALREQHPRVQCEETDTYEAIKAEKRRFDWVISDNPMQEHGGHQEHFDLFPFLPRLAKEKAVLTFSIIPTTNNYYRDLYPGLFNKAHLEARAAFYDVDHPEKLGPEDFRSAFSRHLSQEGRKMDWWHIEARNPLLSYFVCGVEGDNAQNPSSGKASR